MGLDETEVGNFEENVGARPPSLYMLDWDTDSSYAAFVGCQGGVPGANIVVCEAQSPNDAVYDI